MSWADCLYQFINVVHVTNAYHTRRFFQLLVRFCKVDNDFREGMSESDWRKIDRMCRRGCVKRDILGL